MSENFRKLRTEPLVVRARHVSYSIEMIADICEGYDRALDASDFVASACMLDAFYVHIRLLADFLVRSTSHKDFGPNDFGVTWDAPRTDESARLNAAWEVASSYVVHFGRPRIPTGSDDLEAFKVGSRHFRELATDALVVYTAFVDAVEAAAPRWDGDARIPDPKAELDAWDARVHYDASKILRGAQRDAESKLAE